MPEFLEWRIRTSWSWGDVGVGTPEFLELGLLEA